MSGRSSVSGWWRTVRSAALITLALLSGCWLQQGGNGGRTRYNAAESGLTAANVDTLAVAWTAPVPGVVGEAIVSGGRVFVRSDPSQTQAGTTALDAATGNELWSVSLIDVSGAGSDAVALSTSVAMVDGRVATGHVALAPAGHVCVAMPDFLDPATGAGGGGVGNDGFPGARAVSGGVVATTLLGFDDDCSILPTQLQVIGRIDGSFFQWRFEMPGPFFPRPPIIAGNLVVVRDLGTLYAFEAAGCGGPSDCPPVWTAPYGGDPAGKATGPIWVQQDAAVVGLSRATGDPVVALALAGSSRGFAVDGSRVYAGSVQSGGRVGVEAFADSCTGSSCTPVWRSTVPGTAIGEPIVGGGVVYATVVDGGQVRLVAFAASGCGAAACEPVASVALPSDGSLSLSGSRVYVSGAGSVTALTPGH